MINNMFIGSNAIHTSVAKAEIVPSGTTISDFQLLNDQACTVRINNGPVIYLRALQGLSLGFVSSLKIQEGGITYNWIGSRG
jgi:hypothetical protein